MQSDNPGQMKPPESETPSEVVACMEAFLEPVKQLQSRWTSRVVMLALMTHATAGIKALIESGEYSKSDAEFLSRDFRENIMKAVAKTKLRKPTVRSN